MTAKKRNKKINLPKPKLNSALRLVYKNNPHFKGLVYFENMTGIPIHKIHEVDINTTENKLKLSYCMVKGLHSDYNLSYDEFLQKIEDDSQYLKQFEGPANESLEQFKKLSDKINQWRRKSSAY